MEKLKVCGRAAHCDLQKNKIKIKHVKIKQSVIINRSPPDDAPIFRDK